jgi:DNA-binding NarL/FixJ family response regulator
LIAQGDVDSRAVLGWLLGQDNRFEVVSSVGSGEEAVGHQASFGAALIDIALPGIDALRTVRTLRERSPRATIVILASVDAPYLRAAAADAGADGYFNLAVEATRLGDLLANLCADKCSEH